MYLAKAIIFTVVMYECESWTIKKAEGWRTDAFELWYWRRKTLESPLDSKEIKPVNHKGNQPWLFIGIVPFIGTIPMNSIHWKEWLWNWSSSTLATWCEDLIHWKRPWCWERFKARGEWDNRGQDGWMASPTQWTWVWASSGSWLDTEAWCAEVHGVAKSRTWLSNWTELKLNL